MTWLPASGAGATPLDRVLALRPDLGNRLQTFAGGFWTHPDVDPVLVELCRLRVATLLGAPGEQRLRHAAALEAGLGETQIAALDRWPTDPAFGAPARAALALAEQVFLDPHAVTGVQRATMAAEIGEAGLVVLVQSITLHESLGRFEMLFAVEPGDATVVPRPPPLPPLERALPDDVRESALARAPALLAAFLRLYGALWNDGIVDRTVLEVVRIRNARVTDCGYCRNVRFAAARDAGLTEAQVSLVNDAWSGSSLPARHKAALGLADAFLRDPRGLEAPARARLLEHFTAAELVELGIGLVCFRGLSKVAVALGQAPRDMPLTVVTAPAL